MLKFSIYRFNSEQKDIAPYMQEYELNKKMLAGPMLLDALIAIQQHLDSSLSFRRSCREGVCGSDGMNINGKNGLACIIPLNSLLGETIVLKPLPGMPVIRDLIVDLDNFYEQYKKVQPYLQNNQDPPVTERLQSIEERAKLDGLYECILCACCSSACPIYLRGEQEKFLGPAAMLQAARFVMDSRDTQAIERMIQLDGEENLFHCRNILTCIEACPKGLDPNKALHDARKKILDS